VKPADNYILNQPEPYRSMLLHIVAVLESSVTEFEMQYRWKIPYVYHKGKPFCYLNASHKKQFVDVGFSKGFKLEKNQDVLVADGGRNTIKSLRYTTLEAIDNAVLLDVVKEAMTLYP